jgi:hypothetical protein
MTKGMKNAIAVFVCRLTKMVPESAVSLVAGLSLRLYLEESRANFDAFFDLKANTGTYADLLAQRTLTTTPSAAKCTNPLPAAYGTL